jgi:hypothetical protein
MTRYTELTGPAPDIRVVVEQFTASSSSVVGMQITLLLHPPPPPPPPPLARPAVVN